ncbi:uncharacterized protein AAGF69_015639 [Amazona ochrocephala]
MRLSRARPGEIHARLLGCLPSSPCVPETPSSDGYPWAEGCADRGQGPPVSEEGYGNYTCVWPRTSWATAMPASSCMQSQLSKVPNGTSSEQDEQQTVKRQRTSLERRPKERPRARTTGKYPTLCPQSASLPAWGLSLGLRSNDVLCLFTVCCSSLNTQGDHHQPLPSSALLRGPV